MDKENSKHLGRRVVVTGIGAVTPIGLNFPEFWKNALAGKSGISNLECFDVSEYTTKIAGEIKDFKPEDFFDKKISRRMDRFIQLGYAASLEARADAELDLDKTDRDRVGIFVGSGIGGLKFIENQKEVIINKGPQRVSPFLVPMTTIDMASGQISVHMGIHGPNFGVVSACATGSNSIGLAYRFIKYGDADVMFAGGAEAAIVPLCLSGFGSAKALSTRNHEPELASRPFDADRDGFVVGEGAAVLVLEELEHAKKRGAKIYGEVLGFSATGDGYHLTAPHPEGRGAARAMRMAIGEAGITPQDVAYINAHGTATKVGDIAEARSINNVFGDHAQKVSINATKSLVGHLLGAAGALGAACTIQSVFSDEIHPSINIDNKDPECNINVVTRKVETPVPYAICNSFGFGGHNICLAFGKYKD